MGRSDDGAWKKQKYRDHPDAAQQDQGAPWDVVRLRPPLWRLTFYPGVVGTAMDSGDLPVRSASTAPVVRRTSAFKISLVTSPRCL